MKQLIAIVGPTGIGKSRLALRLAHNFNGEIVSADSRQIYCYMDIGTAKPTFKEMSLVPHHLINIISPADDFSLAQYQELAHQSITEIHQRGSMPFLVGGSGQYVWALLEGWKVPQVAPDTEYRKTLEEQAMLEGGDALYQKLVEIDPVMARNIDPRNVRRVIRALEINKNASVPASKLRKKQESPYSTLIIGLTADREELYQRIDNRVNMMIEQGFVEEVEKLLDLGYDFNLSAMSSIGYKQIGYHLKGEMGLASAVQQIKFETHRFVRQQYTWFRLKDERIRWFDINKVANLEISEAVSEFLETKDNR